jgi:hypothetical protein
MGNRFHAYLAGRIATEPTFGTIQDGGSGANALECGHHRRGAQWARPRRPRLERLHRLPLSTRSPKPPATLCRSRDARPGATA